ncbi:MAG: PAS domain S-box protein [Patescibacteria group bacterium]
MTINEHRCQSCGRLLAKDLFLEKGFEIKCIRCGTLNSIFLSFSDQIIITDRRGIILFVNDAVEKNTGYSKEEVIGQTPAKWGKQMTNEFYQKLWQKINEEKRSVSVRIMNRRKNGTLYWAQLRISPIINLKNQIEFLVGLESVLPEKDLSLKEKQVLKNKKND